MRTALRAPVRTNAHPAAPGQRRRVVAMAVLLLPLVVLVCSTAQEGATVDSSLTQTVAQDRMVELLASSLAGLPATASLDVVNPRAPQNPFQSSQTAPCDDNDTTSSGPVNVTLYRWAVDGTPPRTVGDVATVSATWTAAGWSVQTRPDGSAVATTPDGYTLRASKNDGGDFAIIAGSPCFPRQNTGGLSAPKIITRPAG